MAGSLAEIGCFSFYPGKNLGAYGDGGAIVTSSKEIYEKTRMMRNYGQSKKYFHDFIGSNSRLDEIQAAVLRVKLRHLRKWTEKRRENAKHYSTLLSSVPQVKSPTEADHIKHVYHLYVIRVEKPLRDKLQAHLNGKGISTGLHYPRPIHLQKAYAYLGYKAGDLPITENYADEILSLPMFPELKPEEIEFIVNAVKEFFQSR
jgi:dTDP-4-amino-4,6-dideoxygalactose transaminase